MIDNNLFEPLKKQGTGIVARFIKVWKGENLTQLDQRVLLTLRNRAWGCFCIQTLVRVTQVFLQTGGWYSEQI